MNLTDSARDALRLAFRVDELARPTARTVVAVEQRRWLIEVVRNAIVEVHIAVAERGGVSRQTALDTTGAPM